MAGAGEVRVDGDATFLPQLLNLQNALSRRVLTRSAKPLCETAHQACGRATVNR